MKSETELSGSEIVLELLKVIWMPTVEARRVQNELNVHSLNETSAAAERAGCEVCHVDLPAKVSGFAKVIEGKPHIVVNRAKSREQQQYTLSHELGHQVLHLNPSSNPVRSRFSSHKDIVEFEAHMFAAAWIMNVADEKEREDLLRNNPELSAYLFVPIFMTGGILVGGLLAYLLSRFCTRLSRSAEEQ